MAHVKKEPKCSFRVKQEPGSQKPDTGVLKRIQDRVKTLRTDGVYLDLMDLFIFAENNHKVHPLFWNVFFYLKQEGSGVFRFWTIYGVKYLQAGQITPP